jgi:ABC-type nitrate/sulfonate/bicarbonate transport systems, periplasmic components
MKWGITLKLKKILMLFIAVMLPFTAWACAGTDNNGSNTVSETLNETTSAETSAETVAERTPVNVTALIGPTGMGMAKLMDDNAAGTTANNYTFTLSSAPDDVTASLINGSTDFAALPVNLASVLYNKTKGNIQIAAVNTLGVLYILENGNTINSIADLKGKTIYATGQGSSPEYVLRYVLAQNGIDPDKDVTIEFKSEHAELATLMASGDVVLGMLPEPNVTSVLNANSDVRVALDLNAEWQSLTGMPMILGCVVVRSDFAQAHPDAVTAFLDEYKASIDYTLENNSAAAQLIEKYGILPKAALAESALPRCNIVFENASEYKDQIMSFLNILYTFNPKSVGGALPGDDFILKFD